MEGGEEKKGFTIRDRRVSSHPEETAKGESGRKEGPEREGGEKKPEPHPLQEIDFSAFIFSLSTSALLHLGEVPDPATQKREKNLPLAKQTIDILGMLQEKTQGNLNPEEKKLMEAILTDLRWRYVREAKD
jgi:hypothetical protein